MLSFLLYEGMKNNCYHCNPAITVLVAGPYSGPISGHVISRIIWYRFILIKILALYKNDHRLLEMCYLQPIYVYQSGTLYLTIPKLKLTCGPFLWFAHLFVALSHLPISKNEFSLKLPWFFSVICLIKSCHEGHILFSNRLYLISSILIQEFYRATNYDNRSRPSIGR